VAGAQDRDVRAFAVGEGLDRHLEAAALADELEDRGVDPIDDRALELARSTIRGVLADVARKEVLRDEDALVVQEPQGLGEALGGHGGHVHARPLRQLVDQLVEMDVGARRHAQRRRGRDLDVDLLDVDGLPHVGPELHAGRQVPDALGPLAQHALHDRHDLLLRDAVAGREVGHLGRRDAGADQWLVGMVAHAHDLVGREVVVDVARVGEEQLAAQLGERRHRVAEVELQRAHQVGVRADALLRAGQDVG
jgi:hypothetical protein